MVCLCAINATSLTFFSLNSASPIFPFFERSQPQLSRSPRLQFLVRVYMTPAALIACTKEVSLVAAKERKFTKINFNSYLLYCYTFFYFILMHAILYFFSETSCVFCAWTYVSALMPACQPTASQSSKLGCAVGTVPSIPRKLVFTLLQPSLCAHLHAPRIGEIGLQRMQGLLLYRCCCCHITYPRLIPSD